MSRTPNPVTPTLRVRGDLLVDGVTGRAWDASEFHDPALFSWLYDDFLMVSTDGAGLLHSAGEWTIQGTTFGSGASLVRVDGDTVLQGLLSHNFGAAVSTFGTPFSTANNFDLEFRWAQFGAVAGTRRFGLFGAASTGDGTGIYFRHTQAGTLTAVGRTGASETVIDTGIAAANGTYHICRLVAVAAQIFQVYVDGTSYGLLNAGSVPTTALGLHGMSGAAAANTGFLLDYVAIWQSR